MNLSESIDFRMKNEHKLHFSLYSLINNSNSIYVIGKNNESLNVIKNLSIIGIIDDYSSLDYWNGIKVFKSENIDRESIIINCSTSISPISVRKKLKKIGFTYIVDYYELMYQDSRYSKPQFCIEAEIDFHKNIDKWENLYSKLSDKNSIRVLEDILLFRLTCNPIFMNDYTIRFSEQYLENFMDYNQEVMVDAGAFDGDTTQLFCEKYPNYKKVHLFEPSKQNILKAKERLKGFDRIEYHKIGLSDIEGSVMFEDNLGSSSKVSHTGIQTIKIDKLDSLLREEISFIKMDIEGWEIPAIKGCENHIRNEQPKLAIAVYHKISDFWEIPQIVLAMNRNYKIFLRHYTEGWSETIMFFKPINN